MSLRWPFLKLNHFQGWFKMLMKHATHEEACSHPAHAPKRNRLCLRWGGPGGCGMALASECPWIGCTHKPQGATPVLLLSARSLGAPGSRFDKPLSLWNCFAPSLDFCPERGKGPCAGSRTSTISTGNFPGNKIKTWRRVVQHDIAGKEWTPKNQSQAMWP